MSRAWWIFFSLYTCPSILPSVKRNYLPPMSNCAYFRHSYVFKADRSSLWSKVSQFLSGQRLVPKPMFVSFLSGFWKYWFRYMARGGGRWARKGVKTNWGARWWDGDYTIPPFSEWSWNRGVLWSPSHTLSWGQAGEKSICVLRTMSCWHAFWRPTSRGHVNLECTSPPHPFAGP